MSDSTTDAEVEPDDELDADGDEGNRSVAGTAAAVLEYLVGEIVADPDAVSVEVEERGRRIRLDVIVGPGDMGRVIGRRGRVAQAIRTVVRAAAARDGVEVEVEFVD